MNAFAYEMPPLDFLSLMSEMLFVFVLFHIFFNILANRL